MPAARTEADLAALIHPARRRAFRPADRGDLELLSAELDITTPQRAADLVQGVYGEHPALPGRAELELSARAVLEGMRRPRS